MTFPAHQSGVVQAWLLLDVPGQLDRRLARLHSSAIHARIHFDHHAQPDISLPRRAIQRVDILGTVDGDYDIGARKQAQQARNLLLADHLVGDQNVSNACIGHHFGFANLGAGDAECSRLEQPGSDLRHFQSLGVRPPAHSRRAEPARHALDVPLHDVQVHQERWGVKFVRRPHVHQHTQTLPRGATISPPFLRTAFGGATPWRSFAVHTQKPRFPTSRYTRWCSEKPSSAETSRP